MRGWVGEWLIYVYIDMIIIIIIIITVYSYNSYKSLYTYYHIIRRRAVLAAVRRPGLRKRDETGQHSWSRCIFERFFDRGAFWILPLAYFCLPKSARTYLFPQSVEISYLCSGPVCPRPRPPARPCSTTTLTSSSRSTPGRSPPPQPRGPECSVV